MTRLKLIPWLAIPALLLMFGPVQPTATAAPPLAAPQESDDVIYLPMGEQPEWLKQGVNSGLQTSTAGEVTIAQYGAADAVVGNNNGFFAVRFDPPFNAAYTITGISFPSRTQFQIPATPGRFISIRVLGMNGSGLPDKSVEYYQKRRVPVSSNGGMNTIPLSIAGSPGQTFFVVFQFPRPPASADTFPFLYTDRNLTERGLFANSFTTDTNSVVRTAPATVGTFGGTALFADQNLVVSMTCQITGQAPMNAFKNVGLNLRDDVVTWSFGDPDNILADGEPTGNTHPTQAELVKRDLAWNLVYSAGAGQGKVQLPAVPGSGMQIWGLRTRDNAGNTSVVSNVTITGPATIVGYPSAAEDADEANGKDSDVEAAPVNPPFTGRPETLWPAGDQDNYWFFAQPGQVISVTAAPAGIDFRNDMSLVVNVLDNNHDVVESEIASGPGSSVHLTHNVAPPSGSSNNKAFKRYFVQVYDRNGSADDPANWNRVLVPAGYNLDVDVYTPTAFALNDDPQLSGKTPVADDQFSFANAGANPTRGHATFSYVIPKTHGEASVKLRIYDVRGRLMSTLVNGSKTAGTHFASWSGHDLRGNRVASGPYFARIDAGSFKQTVRIVMN